MEFDYEPAYSIRAITKKKREKKAIPPLKAQHPSSGQQSSIRWLNTKQKTQPQGTFGTAHSADSRAERENKRTDGFSLRAVKAALDNRVNNPAPNAPFKRVGFGVSGSTREVINAEKRLKQGYSTRELTAHLPNREEAKKRQISRAVHRKARARARR